MIQFKENTQTDGKTEGRTEGRKEGRTDRPYFIGTYPAATGGPNAGYAHL